MRIISKIADTSSICDWIVLFVRIVSAYSRYLPFYTPSSAPAHIAHIFGYISAVRGIGPTVHLVSGAESEGDAVFGDMQFAAYNPAHFVVGVAVFAVAGTGAVLPGKDIEVAFVFENLINPLFVADAGMLHFCHRNPLHSSIGTGDYIR